MLHIVLYQPEIPPNTGNVIRLCANTGARLHLIEPLGFTLDDARVRRAGLDYRELSDVRRYKNWIDFRKANQGSRLWAFSTRGSTPYTDADFRDGDALLFGPESRGLPKKNLDEMEHEQILRIPMQSNSRSLNLSNTVAVGLYEALRQTGFNGLV